MSELRNLPDVIFAPKDPAEIERNLLAGWEDGGGPALYPADPRRLFFKTNADGAARISAMIDHAAKMNLLAYSEGDFLDHIGALLQVVRLAALPAVTTVRFVLSAPQLRDVVIPAGTRVSKLGTTFYFATVESHTIPVGETLIDVIVEALEVGVVGNGFLAGEINQLVDPLPWIDRVVSLEGTAGGADVESDSYFKERIHLAPEKFSTAGPSGAYEYWTKTAQSGIVDVAVWSPSPGVVEVLLILEDGIMPNEAVKARVDDVLNDRERRPLTDHVQVDAPEAIPFDVEVEWWFDEADVIQKPQIKAAVQKALSDWVVWQKSKIGRDINISELIKLIQLAGAKRVNVISPEFQVVKENQIGIANPNPKLTLVGDEDA